MAITNIATPTINAEQFLAHVVSTLSAMGIEMSDAKQHSIRLSERHPSEVSPKECYFVQCWAKTPDYNGKQPDNRTEMHYYPIERTLFINLSYNGEWNNILFPEYAGMNAVEHALKRNGMTDLNGKPLALTFE